jgi:YHS domain-containing protein
MIVLMAARSCSSPWCSRRSYRAPLLGARARAERTAALAPRRLRLGRPRLQARAQRGRRGDLPGAVLAHGETGVTDPVCGMKVDHSKAVTRQVGGTTLHFCSEHCLAAYEADPERYGPAGRREPPKRMRPGLGTAPPAEGLDGYAARGRRAVCVAPSSPDSRGSRRRSPRRAAKGACVPPRPRRAPARGAGPTRPARS